MPFDLAHAQTLAYFGPTGISRVQLMRTLATSSSPSPLDIAVEALGLSSVEGSLIIKPNPSGQTAFWGTIADPTAIVNNVATFLNVTGISYVDLQTIMNMGDTLDPSWINPYQLSLEAIKCLFSIWTILVT